MYLAVPVLLYAGERTTRALRSSIKAVTIQKVYNMNCCGNSININNSILSLIEYCAQNAGGYLSWKCVGTSHVKASRVQIQEWTVHVRELCCCVSIWMVSGTSIQLINIILNSYTAVELLFSHNQLFTYGN